MSGDHVPNAISSAGRHKRPLLIAFGLTFAYMLVEAVGGIVFGSLALLSDAGHMLTDVVGLGMALAAIQLGQSRRSRSHTYGLYRLEVLAALVNAAMLFAVGGYVLIEAYRRLTSPPDVLGLPLTIVAAVGLVINLISFRLLQAGASESMNVRGAYLEVMSDMLGSVGVLLAGVILITTGWPYADPVIGAAIGLFILPRAWTLGREALAIILELAPSGLDIGDVERRLGELPGVDAVHDLHVWTITSGFVAASAHLALTKDADLGSVLGAATELLEHEFGIEHATLQCEPPGFKEAVAAI